MNVILALKSQNPKKLTTSMTSKVNFFNT